MKIKYIDLLLISLFFNLLLILNFPLTAQEAWQWLESATDENIVSVLLMGDTNIQNREHPGEVYKYVLPTLKAADLRFANLESAFAGTSKDPLVPDIPHKKNWKHSDPWQALLRSLKILDDAKIRHIGKGRDLFGYLLSVNGEDGAKLSIKGKEIVVEGIE